MWGRFRQAQNDTLPARVIGAGLTIIGVVAIVLAGSFGTAALADRGPKPFHARLGNRMIVAGVLPPAMKSARALGPTDGSQQLDLSIGLQLSNASQFAALVSDQQNPKSARYHKYLTPQAFALQYGPSSANVASVLHFLQSAGMHVTSISSNHLLVDATTTVTQAEQAFGVSIENFQIGTRRFYAPDRDPTVPDYLAPMILNVGGLDSLFRMQPHFVVRPHATTATTGTSHQATPNSTTPVAGFNPTDISNAYDMGKLVSAVNGMSHYVQPIGLFELAPVISSDLTTYEQQYGLANTAPVVTSIDGAPAYGDASGSGEVSLDMELVQAVNPYAVPEIYVGPNTTQGINDTYNAMVSAQSIISTSWGTCEAFEGQAELTQLNTLFAQAKSTGRTIFASAGDSGTDDCRLGGDSGLNMPPSVDSPAGDPNVVAAGGTSLTLNSGVYGSETVWNNSTGATGGGQSSFFSQPSWQVGAGVQNAYSMGNRLLPDVAADADPNTGYAIYCTSVSDCGGQGWLEFGGTSASAPLWAALYGVISEYVNAQPPYTLGWANQVLYQTFSSVQAYPAFHDVTSGNNAFDYTTAPFNTEYPATSCYDMTTGMGSPDAWNLARDIFAGLKNGFTPGGICQATAVTATQLLSDTSFESSPSGWQQFSQGGYNVIGSKLNSHSGTHSFFACGYPNCDDRVWQTFTVPATVNSANLSFWVYGTTNFTFLSLGGSSSPPCLNHFIVTIATPDGTVIDTVQATCNLFTDFGFVLESFPVTAILQAHTGQQLQLMIRATNAALSPQSGNDYDFYYVDDVALKVS